jgi:predicted phage-related endonuclease
MNKIEEKDLNELINLNNLLKEKIIKLGNIEYNILLLNSEKKQIQNNLQEINDKEKRLHDILIKKYGDNLNINLETGEY